MTDSENSQSLFPSVHQFLELMPTPVGLDWKSLNSEQVTYRHLYWGVALAILWTAVRLIISVTVNAFASKLTGQRRNSLFQRKSKVIEKWQSKKANRTVDESVQRALSKLESILRDMPNLKRVVVSQLVKQVDLDERLVAGFVSAFKEFNQNETLISRIKEQCFQVVSYGSLFVLGAMVLSDTDWAWDRSKFYKHKEQQYFSPDLRLYYFMEVGLYFHFTVSHLVWDMRLSDFWVMFLHHLATLYLLIFSYGGCYLRVGAVIVFLHDVADPWLQLAKLCKCFEWEAMTTFFFAGLIISWMPSRLYYLPTIGIFSLHFNIPEDVPGYNEYVVNAAIVALWFLYILHWYWYSLILKIVYNTLVGGNDLDDIRTTDDES